MKYYRLRAKALLFLFLIFTYVISAIVSFQFTSAHTFIFISNLVVISFIFTFLFISKRLHSLPKKLIPIFIIAILSTITIPVYGVSWVHAFYFYVFLALSVFYIFKKDIGYYINAISVSFIIIFIMALINFSLSGLLTGERGFNYFQVSLFGYQFITLYGFEGSTAHIDSLASLVALISLLYLKGFARLITFLLCAVVIIWTSRFTPLVAFMAGLVSYYFLRSQSLRGVFFFGLFASLFSSILIYNSIPDWIGGEVSRDELSQYERIVEASLRAYTHGRIEIWSSIYTNLSNVRWVDLLFGFPEAATVQIRWGDGITNNPHNAFVNLFVHSGVLGVIFILHITYIFSKFATVKEFSVLVAVFLAAMTNNEIFFPGNPFYLLVLSIILASSLRRSSQKIVPA